MKRRVYVAIPIPAEVQKQALHFQRHDLPVRWIAGKNLHITLIPPWHTADIDGVTRQLQRLQKHKPFTIALNKIEYGPSTGVPRIIWAVGPTTKSILDLQEHVESALGAHHERQFKLHMTLARFDPKKFSPVQKIDEKINWSIPITSVVLMESHLSEAGADYEILHEVKFENIY